MAINNDHLGQRLLPPEPRSSSAWSQPHPSPAQQQPDQQYPFYWAPSGLNPADIDYLISLTK